ncbi:MAG: UDP-N-acetylmuramate--L-alanine ligase [Candidatus Paceibacterota bacterium]
MFEINFSKLKRVHLVGVKGVGMTALAQFLVAQFPHIEFSSSDVADSFLTDSVLKKIKLSVKSFSAKNISSDIDLVISSGAWYEPKDWKSFSVNKKGEAVYGKALNDNVDIKEALKQNIPVITYPQAIGFLSKKYRVIAVAGSHGKSTTTAMLGFALEKAGKSPSVLVGTRVRKWESSGRVGRSKYLVVEADEYREAFLNYKPYGVIVTNIDYDHPDYYKTKASYYRAFKRLISNVDKDGFVVGFGDDMQVASLLKFAQGLKLRVGRYGYLGKDDLVLSDDGVFAGKQMFHTVFHAQKRAGKLSFVGKHMIANAGAAILAGEFIRANRKGLYDGIATFPGTARRFEYLKKTKNEVLIDDYAHHPSEIRATLAGARALYPEKKICAIFQPHMFSRTEKLLADFSKAFIDADTVGIMHVYASAREARGDVSSKDLVFGITKQHKDVRLLASFAEGRKFVKEPRGWLGSNTYGSG